MRTSRKGRKRLEEMARLEEEGRKRWGGMAFRMSRKRRKKLVRAQAGQEPLLKRFVLQNMRMTRSRKRKMREAAAMRQTAQAASISALALLPPVAGEAAGISNVMNDIPAEFDSLRNDRNRIRDFHEAKRNAEEAAQALAQAERDLQLARQNKAEAENALAEALQNLEKARFNLQRISQELANSQVESAQRTREAIAAQQAAADFAPQVWKQETVVQDMQGQRQSLQANYEQLGRDLGYLRDERDGLEERIRQAWESVGWAQNRLNDVMAMVNRAQAIVPEQAEKEAQWEAYDSQLERIDAAIDSEEALLDDLQSQLDALEAAREAAEDAEQEARERVQDLIAEQADGERDVQEGEKDVAETQKWDEEAAKDITETEKSLTETKTWKEKADYDLAHFGEGKGLGTGFEYYTWHGAGQPNGHQLYQPIEFYANEKKWDFSLAVGWLSSDTGLANGHVSGWTDTTLGITYKNDHKINDVRYSLNINVPTGKENAHQNAMMADNLARFNSFSEGWQFTPGIEATHRFTERDSITGRVSYTFRGDYKYRKSAKGSKVLFNDQKINDAYQAVKTAYNQGNYDDNSYLKGEIEKIINNEENLVDYVNANIDNIVANTESQLEIDPEDKFQQEIEYRHIGDTHQWSVKLTHVNSSRAYYRSTLTSVTDTGGRVYPLNWLYDNGYNYDGEEWTLQVFGNRDFDAKNSLQYYLLGNYQAAEDGGTHRYYGGLGWMHRFDKKQSAYILLNYGENHGQSYNWRLDKYESGRMMKAIVLGYDYRIDDTSELRTKLERYNIQGSSSDSYHGWKMSLMWNKSF